MGIKFIKSGEYLLDVRLKRNGKEVARQRVRFFGSKSAADEKFFQLKAELRGDAATAYQPALIFGHILSRYKESRGEIPRSQLPIFSALMEDLGGILMTTFPDKVSQYASILRKLPSKRSGKRLTNATVNRYRAMIFASLNLAVELGTLDKNPITNAHFPKQKEIPRDRFLGSIETQHLLNIIDREAPHLGPLVRFNLQVPCRKNELVMMRRGDLDLFNNAIRIRNGSSKNDDGTWKPIPEDLISYFRTIPADCPFLFYREVKGQYRSLGDFKKAWRRCLRLAGIQDFRFHDGRHIAATNLVDAGVPERAIMDVAGWKTNMLSTYYKSSSKKALGLVRKALEVAKLPPGNALSGGHLVDARNEDGREIGESEGKKAIL